VSLATTAERFARRAARHARARSQQTYRQAGRRWAARRLNASVPAHAKVHIGSGQNHFPGWVNIDLDRETDPDVVLDLRWGIPIPAGRVAFAYTEHVLEHLDLEDGLRMLADCRSMLEPDGVLRIAMPDMRSVIDHYLGDWRDQSWLHWPGHEYIDTPVRMVNVAFREWGHRYLYDHDELVLRLGEVGFGRINRATWGTSDVPELRGLETRDDSLLIVEARP
jgi:predicted SAM-dependent methyltransferase